MFRRLAQWIVVVLLIVSVGGHWVILQGVAWATMLARFSQSMPVAQAVQYTFDGQHPCPLCKLVKAGQEQERKGARLKAPEKLTLALSPPPPALPPPPDATLDFAPAGRLHPLPHKPPLPPPRAA